MLTILTRTDTSQQVEDAVASVNRLDELVTVTIDANIIVDLKTLVVDSDKIIIHLLIATHLQFGYEISEDMVVFSHKSSSHNLAILHHYGMLQNSVGLINIKAFYKEAIKRSENDEVKVFTTKHISKQKVKRYRQVCYWLTRQKWLILRKTLSHPKN